MLFLAMNCRLDKATFWTQITNEINVIFLLKLSQFSHDGTFFVLFLIYLMKREPAVPASSYSDQARMICPNPPWMSDSFALSRS